MLPKIYGFSWIVFFVSVGILWLAGALTMLAGVVLGFIAFGLIFAGMMCVLPAMVSHPVAKRTPAPPRKARTAATRLSVTAPLHHGRMPIGLRLH